MLNCSIAKIAPAITEHEYPPNILPTKQREDASARLVVPCLGYLGRPYTPDHSDSPQCLPPSNIIAGHDEGRVDESGVAQKILLADVPSSNVPPPQLSQQDGCTPLLGSTSITIEKPNSLVTDHQQPLVPLMNREGSETDIARSAACLEANTTSGGSSPQRLSTISQSTSSAQLQYERPGLQHSPSKGDAGIQQPAFSSLQTTSKPQRGSRTAPQCAENLASMSNAKEWTPFLSETSCSEPQLVTLREQGLSVNATVSFDGGGPGVMCGQCECFKPSLKC